MTPAVGRGDETVERTELGFGDRPDVGRGIPQLGKQVGHNRRSRIYLALNELLRKGPTGNLPAHT